LGHNKYVTDNVAPSRRGRPKKAGEDITAPIKWRATKREEEVLFRVRDAMRRDPDIVVKILLLLQPKT